MGHGLNKLTSDNLSSGLGNFHTKSPLPFFYKGGVGGNYPENPEHAMSTLELNCLSEETNKCVLKGSE